MNHLHPPKGAALILLLTIIILGATTLFLIQLNQFNSQPHNQLKTARALAQAKEALIGFALTYAENHPGQPQGYLPCPDLNGDGRADPPCAERGRSVLGRLPWLTLGLPPLKDGSQTCLWYAVSGTYKDNPKQVLTTDLSRHPGLFKVRNEQGNIVAGDTQETQIIAIVFAPGKSLSHQTRVDYSTPSQPTICGSNVAGDQSLNRADQYLDSLNNFHNATGTGTFSPHLLPANNVLSQANAPLITSEFLSAPLTLQGDNIIFNDTLILITPQDFKQVYKRMNAWVANQVDRCLKRYASEFRSQTSLTYTSLIGNWSQPEQGSYRDRYQLEIAQFVADELSKFEENYKSQYGEPPSAEQLIEKTKQLTQQSLGLTSKYPWASALETDPSPNYEDDSQQRFGRIPSAPLLRTQQDNPDMSLFWPADNPAGLPNSNQLYCGIPLCFDEQQSTDSARCAQQASCLSNCQTDTCLSECLPGKKDKSWYWWWWEEWKELVFFAVDDNYSPLAPTYISVRGEQSATTMETLVSPPFAISPGNHLKLDGSPVQTVILIANQPLTEQTRQFDSDKVNVENYLEGSNAEFITGNEYMITNGQTNQSFNDVVCSNSTCPFP